MLRPRCMVEERNGTAFLEQAARPEFSVLDQELTETIRALGLEGKSAAQVDAIMRASCYRSRL